MAGVSGARCLSLHFEMLAAFERQDRLAYFKLNQAIHRAIAAAAHNAPLAALTARDGTALARTLHAHLGSTWTKVSETLKIDASDLRP